MNVLYLCFARCQLVFAEAQLERLLVAVTLSAWSSTRLRRRSSPSCSRSSRSAAGCRRARPDSGVTRPDRPNVLLVTIDTLRADHVGCYGYQRGVHTDDRCAGRARRPLRDGGGSCAADRTIARVDPHRPDAARPWLSEQQRIHPGAHVKTAAEDFRKAGYRTGGLRVRLSARSPVRIRSRIRDVRRPAAARATIGVEHRTSSASRMRRPTRCSAGLRPPAHGGSAAGALVPLGPLLRSARAVRAAAPIWPSASVKRPYDGEIAFVDRQLGRLLQTLDVSERDRPHDRARHGRPRREPRRARRGHARHLRVRRDASSAVDHGRAAASPPGACPEPWPDRSTCCRRSLDYAGLPLRADVDGRSLRPAADGQQMADAPAYAESLYPELELGWAPLHAWRTAGFKFIKAPRPELYDLRERSLRKRRIAPGEQRARVSDLAGSSTRRCVIRRRRPRRHRSIPKRPSGCARSAT